MAGNVLDRTRRRVGIALVVLDYAMPGMSGAELAREMASRRPELPAIFITGYADLAALRQVGEERIVQKPFREAELAAKVRGALRLAYGAMA